MAFLGKWYCFFISPQKDTLYYPAQLLPSTACPKYLACLSFQLATSYKGSHVLILGGGDGGLLKELLDLGENRPEFVTMVEIDPVVLEACSEHMPGVCGPYLEQRSGANFEILCDDAVQKMEAYRVRTV